MANWRQILAWRQKLRRLPSPWRIDQYAYVSRHRLQLSPVAIVVGALSVGLLGAAGQWAVGEVLDSAKATATREAALAVDVDRALDDDVVVPTQAVSSLPSPPKDSHELARAARAVGGAPVSPTYFLIAYGVVDTPVIIRGIDAVDITCREVDGDWVGAVLEGGGAVNELPLTIRIVNGSNSVEGVPEMTMDGQSDQWEFPRQVSGAEAEGFLVQLAAPSRSICSLRLRVEFTSRGESDHILVEDDGRPFTVAASDIVEPALIY